MVDYFLQNELSICYGSITYLKFDSYNCKIYQMHSSLLSTRENCNLSLLLLALGLIFSVSAFAQPKIEMVFVEGGTFQMGSLYETSEFSDERTLHSVSINSFSMGKYEITQSVWHAVMNNNPSSSSCEDCDNCPVENVSWVDVQEFIWKLNGLSDKNYRLPTEAEWEYAARGGKNSGKYFFSGSTEANSVAWHNDNSGPKGLHPIGEKEPNELGLYDMSGNVEEWCSDWYGDYKSLNQKNPIGPLNGKFRVTRGGSWLGNKYFCRSTNRDWHNPDYGYYQVGFRLVLPANP
jgi:formylglycine-generating enzyme required for sulfatase activity